jgi:hypothetical protein
MGTYCMDGLKVRCVTGCVQRAQTNGLAAYRRPSRAGQRVEETLPCMAHSVVYGDCCGDPRARPPHIVALPSGDNARRGMTMRFASLVSTWDSVETLCIPGSVLLCSVSTDPLCPRHVVQRHRTACSLHPALCTRVHLCCRVHLANASTLWITRSVLPTRSWAVDPSAGRFLLLGWARRRHYPSRGLSVPSPQ